MRGLAKALVGLAALTFVLAIIAAFNGRFMYIYPEGFSRASTNLALLAIALMVTFEDRPSIPRAAGQF